MTPKDTLLDPDGKPVPIKSVHIGDFVAGFHHIATKKENPKPNLENHLLNTNGIISADYAVQLFSRDKAFNTGFVSNHDNLPIVGSPEYVAKYGKDSLQAPKLPAGYTLTGIGGVNKIHISGYNTRDLTGPLFIPAVETIVKVPSNAASFISAREAAQKASDPHRPWNDPLSRQWTEYVLDQHRAFYPNIVYQLDWADDTVNAFAWVENGVRHVAIKGGLVRHVALQIEGIALVIAHETGHHYGGPPTFPSGLSCEGQADYAGVRDVMRKVWFGEQYAAMAAAGIHQMANFFGVPDSPVAPGGSAGCDHPPGDCRIATYYAAFRLTDKPGCAS